MTHDNATKLQPHERKAVILSAALKVANDKGLSEVTFKSIADACQFKTMPRTVAHYYKIGEIRSAVASDSRASDDVKADAVAMGIR